MKKTEGRKTQFRGIKALGDGKYRLRIYVNDPKQGREIEIVRTVTAESVQDAYQAKQTLLVELRQKVEEVAPIASPVSMRFGDVVDRWWAEISARKLEEDPAQAYLCPSTAARYETTVKQFLKPTFGSWDATQMTAEDVRRWRNALREAGYAASTTNAHHRVLKSVLRSIKNNAASEVKELNEKVGALITRTEPNRLDEAELARFLEVARTRWNQHYALILVLFTTTLRVSTALALRWEDLDLETNEIVVRRRRSGYGKKAKVVPGVKRDRFGEDLPPLHPAVYAELLKLKAKYNEKQLASGLLFPTPEGEHHYRTILAKPFEDILEHAKITKRFTPHGCRRTGAKRYGMTSGAAMAMEIAGHLTTEMHKHYAGGADANAKQAAARAAFPKLQVIEGGASEPAAEVETGTQNRDPGAAAGAN